MPKDFQINSWDKGMNQDVSPHKMPNDMYYELRNGQVVSSESGNMYGITNIKGNKKLFNIPTIPRTQVVSLIGISSIGGLWQWVIQNPDTGVPITRFPFPVIMEDHDNPTKYVFDILKEDVQELIDNGHILLDYSEQYNNFTITYLTASDLEEQDQVVQHFNFNPAVQGNYEIKTQIRSEAEFVGGGDFLDDMVLFTVCKANGDNEPFSQVWYLEYDEVNNEVINVDSNNALDIVSSMKYNNTLGFNKSFPIRRVISLKETEDFGTIYWTDAKNPVYTLNIFDESSRAIPPSLLSLQTSSTYGNLFVDSIGFNGILPSSASVQFSYRLSTQSGALTPFAPLSGLFPLSDESVNPLAENFHGTQFDEENIISNRSVNLSFNNLDAKYDFIEIAAITYQYQNIPEVFLETNISIPADGNLQYSFTGNSSINIDPLEIGRISENILTANDLAVKDNRLIVLGLTTRNEDLDYDSRAYRFNTNGLAKILTGSGEETFFTYNALVNGSVVIPENHDCINPYNTTDYVTNNIDVNYQNRFGKVGGSGINVDYEIITMELVASEDVSIAPSRDNIDIGRFENTDIILSENETLTLDGELKNYMSPTVAAYFKGYKRGEIYRFGIKFYDNYGVPYPVKWVGDVKFPDRFNNVLDIDNQEVDCINGDNPTGFRLNRRTDDDTMLMYPLGVRFTLNNLGPIRNKISGFTIVRADRTQQDKSVLGEGMVNGSIAQKSVGDSSAFGEINAYPTLVSMKTVESNTDPVTGRRYIDWVCQFTSPESHNDQTRFNFNQGDYVTITDLEASENFGTSNKPILLFNKNTITNNASYNQCRKKTSLMYSAFTDINDRVQNPFSPNGIVVDYQNSKVLMPVDDDPVTQRSYWCTTRKHWLSSETPSVVGRIVPTDTVNNNDSVVWIGNYKRDITSSQYGGNLFTSRSSTKYIDATSFIAITDNNDQQCLVFKGDTSCHYWDVLWGGFYNSPQESTILTMCNIVIESSYNLEYRPEERSLYKFLSYDSSLIESSYNSLFTSTNGIKPSDWILGESYDYNHAYNQSSNIKYFFSRDPNSRQTGTLLSAVWPSEPKLLSERIDNWRLFLPANLYDLEAVYGPINRGELLSDQIVVFQDRGIAFVPINERVMINDENSTALVLGTGDVVGKHKYISTTAGTKQPFSVCKTESGIYYVDTRHKKLSMISSGGGGNISVVKGMDSYFRRILNNNDIINVFDPLNGKGIVSVYDQETNRLNYTLLSIKDNPINSGKIGETIVLNERDQSFRYFLDHDPKYYMTNGNVVLTPNPFDLKSMYIEEKGSYGVYYDNLFNFINTRLSLSFYVNKHAPLTKTINNIHFDGEGDIAADLQPLGKISSFEIENNTDGTNPSNNITKRFHTYRHTVGRSKNDNRSRITGPWFKVTFKHLNLSNQLVNIHDMITYFDVYNLNLQK